MARALEDRPRGRRLLARRGAGQAAPGRCSSGSPTTSRARSSRSQVNVDGAGGVAGVRHPEHSRREGVSRRSAGRRVRRAHSPSQPCAAALSWRSPPRSISLARCRRASRRTARLSCARGLELEPRHAGALLALARVLAATRRDLRRSGLLDLVSPPSPLLADAERLAAETTHARQRRPGDETALRHRRARTSTTWRRGRSRPHPWPRSAGTRTPSGSHAEVVKRDRSLRRRWRARPWSTCSQSSGRITCADRSLPRRAGEGAVPLVRVQMDLTRGAALAIPRAHASSARDASQRRLTPWTASAPFLRVGNRRSGACLAAISPGDFLAGPSSLRPHHSSPAACSTTAGQLPRRAAGRGAAGEPSSS